MPWGHFSSPSQSVYKCQRSTSPYWLMWRFLVLGPFKHPFSFCSFSVRILNCSGKTTGLFNSLWTNSSMIFCINFIISICYLNWSCIAFLRFICFFSRQLGICRDSGHWQIFLLYHHLLQPYGYLQFVGFANYPSFILRAPPKCLKTIIPSNFT